MGEKAGEPASVAGKVADERRGLIHTLLLHGLSLVLLVVLWVAVGFVLLFLSDTEITAECSGMGSHSDSAANLADSSFAADVSPGDSFYVDVCLGTIDSYVRVESLELVLDPEELGTRDDESFGVVQRVESLRQGGWSDFERGSPAGVDRRYRISFTVNDCSQFVQRAALNVSSVRVRYDFRGRTRQRDVKLLGGPYTLRSSNGC